MNMQFEYTCMQDWPVLAWIAECSESDPLIRIRHGRQVETKEAWFCEAIWDGEFEAGDFDLTDLIFGSGARLRDKGVVFVSSGTTVDRLQFLRLADKVLVSNSLAGLLATSGTKVDATYDRYPEFFRSVVTGINAYERLLPTDKGRLELVYFRNLLWDGRDLTEQDKPVAMRDFGSYEKYHGFLTSALERTARNMRDTHRSHQYEMVSALSTGYDSVTAATLCRRVGMKQAFSFHTARGGEQDHGTEIAKILGLDLTIIDRQGWREKIFPEVPFLAAFGNAPDVVFLGASQLLRGRILVTGFHGDKVWAKSTKALGPDIVRGDGSGLSFCEYRLAAGCIHFPVAFMGVRQIRDIHALSNAPELAHWDIASEYSRPICRRIAEDAGIPRDQFGMKKKAVTGLFHKGETLLSDRTRAEYYRWLQGNGETRPRVPGTLLLAAHERFYLLVRVSQAVAHLFPAKAANWMTQQMTRLQRELNRRINVIPYLFPWAIERWAGQYTGCRGRKIEND